MSRKSALAGALNKHPSGQLHLKPEDFEIHPGKPDGMFIKFKSPDLKKIVMDHYVFRCRKSEDEWLHIPGDYIKEPLFLWTKSDFEPIHGKNVQKHIAPLPLHAPEHQGQPHAQSFVQQQQPSQPTQPYAGAAAAAYPPCPTFPTIDQFVSSLQHKGVDIRKGDVKGIHLEANGNCVVTLHRGCLAHSILNQISSGPLAPHPTNIHRLWFNPSSWDAARGDFSSDRPFVVQPQQPVDPRPQQGWIPSPQQPVAPPQQPQGFVQQQQQPQQPAAPPQQPRQYAVVPRVQHRDYPSAAAAAPQPAARPQPVLTPGRNINTSKFKNMRSGSLNEFSREMQYILRNAIPELKDQSDVTIHSLKGQPFDPENPESYRVTYSIGDQAPVTKEINSRTVVSLYNVVADKKFVPKHRNSGGQEPASEVARVPAQPLPSEPPPPYSVKDPSPPLSASPAPSAPSAPSAPPEIPDTSDDFLDNVQRGNSKMPRADSDSTFSADEEGCPGTIYDDEILRRHPGSAPEERSAIRGLTVASKGGDKQDPQQGRRKRVTWADEGKKTAFVSHMKKTYGVEIDPEKVTIEARGITFDLTDRQKDAVLLPAGEQNPLQLQQFGDASKAGVKYHVTNENLNASAPGWANSGGSSMSRGQAASAAEAATSGTGMFQSADHDLSEAPRTPWAMMMGNAGQ
jgi:hypothetical protein